MSSTTDGGRPDSFSHTSEIAEHEWVSDLLRQVADTDDGRLRIAATLAADDLHRIWRWTEHRASQRDRRTHQICCDELEQRGLLDQIRGLTPRQAPDADGGEPLTS
jgi:hypothetical protein